MVVAWCESVLEMGPVGVVVVWCVSVLEMGPVKVWFEVRLLLMQFGVAGLDSHSGRLGLEPHFSLDLLASCFSVGFVGEADLRE